MSLGFDFDFAANPEVTAEKGRRTEWSDGHHLVQITDAGVHVKNDQMGEKSKSIFLEFTHYNDPTLTRRDFYVFESRDAGSIDQATREKAKRGIALAMSRYALVCECVGLPAPTNDLQQVIGSKLVVKIRMKTNTWFDNNGNEKTNQQAEIVDRFPASDWEKLKAQDSYPALKAAPNKSSFNVAQPAPPASISANFAAAGMPTAASSPAPPQGAPAPMNATEPFIEDDVPF